MLLQVVGLVAKENSGHEAQYHGGGHGHLPDAKGAQEQAIAHG